MIDKVLRSKRAVTLVGGGALDAADLGLALAHAPVLAAADSGAGAALAAGHVPMAVIGDFDSLDPADRARIPPARLFPVHEQDSTDFDKAMDRIEAPLVLAVGFLGDRVDHQLAAFNTLIRRTDQPCILIGRHEVIFAVPRLTRLELTPGDTVSLFPMAPVTGRSRGLQWPIDGLDLAPSGRVGTSNRALGPVEISMEGTGLLALVPRARLTVAMRALTSPADAG